MNYMQRIEHWGEAHHPKWLDLLRMALGIFLLLKGIEFANNSSTITSLLQENMQFNALLVIGLHHYIIFAHIAGGALIALGLLTRLACVIQIPVLIGAIIFGSYSLFLPFSQIWLTVIILLLLVFFLVEGNGPWSLERAIEKENETQR
jgi:uncharacterized membrane protein YphA (DoxX/SURF4 family)